MTPRAVVSETEFLSWPESMSRIELIDGLVVRSPAPTFGHQEVLRRLVFALNRWAEGRDVTVGQSPMDVRFGPSRILQPDAFVALARRPFREEGPLTRIPELCIEVLSRREARDRVTKRDLYAAGGVSELWTVSLDGFVERWTGRDLALVERIEATLRTPLLDGFELDVTTLFPED